jgi:hypothetical protein
MRKMKIPQLLARLALVSLIVIVVGPNFAEAQPQLPKTVSKRAVSEPKLVTAVIPQIASDGVQTSESPTCLAVGADHEICVMSGSRPGTYLLVDRGPRSTDETVVGAIPADPAACPDQTFTVRVEQSSATANGTSPFTDGPVVVVTSSPTTCPLASPSKELRLILGSSHVGLGPQDMADGVFVPTRASVAAIASFGPDRAAKSDLSTVRPSVRVDSISIPSGVTTGVPCRRARRPNRCRSNYRDAMKAPPSYGQSRCGNCQARVRLALITTTKDSVDGITDLRSFLGKIDSAGDARLLLDASAIWLTNEGRWLGVHREFDGTCQPLEEVDVYESADHSGAIKTEARILKKRDFTSCI